MSIKQQLEENRKLLKNSSKKLAKQFKVSELEIIQIRKEINDKLGKNTRISRIQELAEESGLELGDIKSGWLKEKNDKSVRFSLKFEGSKSEEESKFKSEFQEFLKDYKSDYKPCSEKDLKISYKATESNLLVISLADVHIDKKDFDSVKTIEEKCKEYQNALFNILVRSFNQARIEKILFVIGNDFFNTDNIHNTTSNFTPQETTVTWDKAYEEGFKLMVTAIKRLKEFCENLDVVLVNGNHCYSKEFYLAHALETYFKEDKNIKFDRTAKERKVYTYGNLFFGLTHGNTKMEKLPLTFATEYYQDWGRCKFKEILLGDKHTNKQTSYVSKNEFNGVQVRILPSLTGTDHWHYENQYTGNIQRGIGMLYSPTQGKQAEIFYNL